MKPPLKLLDRTAEISAGMGFLFILLGLIQITYGILRSIFNINPEAVDSRLFGDTEVINFFIASTGEFGGY